jgi:predicted phosphate transport protein (TIGR00153 family)
MEISHKAVRELVALVAAADEGDWDAAASCQSNISQIEHEADELKHAIRRQLTKHHVLRQVRTQHLLDLVFAQDQIANLSKKAAQLIVWRRMRFPEGFRELFTELLDCTSSATKKARKSIRELDELFETSFRGAEAERVESIISELDEIETRADSLEKAARDAVMGVESQLPPVDVMFLYEAIDVVGEIADMAERVGRRLENLLSV